MNAQSFKISEVEGIDQLRERILGQRIKIFYQDVTELFRNPLRVLGVSATEIEGRKMYKVTVEGVSFSYIVGNGSDYSIEVYED